MYRCRRFSCRKRYRTGAQSTPILNLDEICAMRNVVAPTSDWRRGRPKLAIYDSESANRCWTPRLESQVKERYQSRKLPRSPGTGARVDVTLRAIVPLLSYPGKRGRRESANVSRERPIRLIDRVVVRNTPAFLEYAYELHAWCTRGLSPECPSPSEKYSPNVLRMSLGTFSGNIAGVYLEIFAKNIHGIISVSGEDVLPLENIPTLENIPSSHR